MSTVNLTEEEIREAAWRGHRLLTRWGTDLSQINIFELNMASPCKCILGQAFPSRGYTDALGTVGYVAADELAARDRKKWPTPASYFGFDFGFLAGRSSRKYYEILEDEWKRLLQRDQYAPPPRTGQAATEEDE